MKDFTADNLTEEVIRVIQEESDKPFFLYLSHKAVHGPFTPEPKYKGSLADVPFTLPAPPIG